MGGAELVTTRPFERSLKRCIGVAVLAAALGSLVGAAQAQTVVEAQDPKDGADAGPAGAWYVVGDIEGQGARAPLDRFAGVDDRFGVDDAESPRVALGVTFSNGAADRVMDFTAPSPTEGEDIEDRFTFLVSGAYDWHTGTMVTPRFMAGVGLSYLDPTANGTRIRQDDADRSNVAPAMQLGIGADVTISNSLDLSAEYRASFRGGVEYGGAERDQQLDQKFVLGAKIRF
jgi:opacity protein-like surface antigen